MKMRVGCHGRQLWRLHDKQIDRKNKCLCGSCHTALSCKHCNFLWYRRYGILSHRVRFRNIFICLIILEDRARGNIISYVDHFKVPLLILHAYQDYRCGFEQAEQVFIPMKERNPEIPCRMVMFPNENHGMTRNGKAVSSGSPSAGDD